MCIGTSGVGLIVERIIENLVDDYMVGGGGWLVLLQT